MSGDRLDRLLDKAVDDPFGEPRCTAAVGSEGSVTGRFYLGAPHAHWVADAGVPTFVSRNTLARLKSLPRATERWALDSGGFTEISTHGRWQTTAATYAADVRRYRDEVGHLDWAAPQDWMCEPWIVQKTGLSVAEHIRRTVDSVLELRALAPGLPWAPVIQGWALGDYVDCADAYARAGVELEKEAIVGLGSVCRRQSTGRAAAIVSWFATNGIKLHGFGFKVDGLTSPAVGPRGVEIVADVFASSDSMAWSLDARFAARRGVVAAGCTHKSCVGCLRYALAWRSRLLRSVASARADLSPHARSGQLSLPAVGS